MEMGLPDDHPEQGLATISGLESGEFRKQWAALTISSRPLLHLYDRNRHIRLNVVWSNGKSLCFFKLNLTWSVACLG